MVDKERRSHFKPLPAGLAAHLNEAQKLTLANLEKFGWELRFVRRPLFLPVVPVVFDPDHRKFSVIEEDGSLNEAPAFKVRD